MGLTVIAWNGKSEGGCLVAGDIQGMRLVGAIDVFKDRGATMIRLISGLLKPSPGHSYIS